MLTQMADQKDDKLLNKIDFDLSDSFDSDVDSDDDS